MAGDWIKMRTNLDTNPHVLMIAADLGVPELHIVGMLWKLWSWADSHSLDGAMIPITAGVIDRFSGCQGFAESLRKAGWLTGEDGTLTLPRFTEHNGVTAKSRCETQARVATHRRNAKLLQGNENPLQVKQKLPRAIVRLVTTRDGNKCAYCGRVAGHTLPTEGRSDGFMCLDHVIPESRGGAATPENLVCACGKCNRIKANRTPDECGMRWPVDVTGKRYGCNENLLPEKRREEKKEELTHTHAREPTPLECESKTIREAIAFWNRYWAETHGCGKPDADSRIDAMLAQARAAGWGDDKIADSIRASIGWNAKSWRDPEANHDELAKTRAAGRSAKNGKRAAELSLEDGR